jgi:hypothetical protein
MLSLPYLAFKEIGMQSNGHSDTAQNAVCSQCSESEPHERAVGRTVQARKTFRWRVIFATLAVFFGLCGLTASIFHFALAANLLIQGSAPPGMALGIMAGDTFGMLAATCLIVTAVNLQKGRWSWAGLFFLAGVILGFIAQGLGGGR